MKKNGFTLAEVLITLAIIGVVATMTLPALMTNTAEQQAKSGLKKGINTLTEVAQLAQAIDGYDYSSLSVDTKSDTAQSLYGVLARHTTLDYSKSNLSVDGFETGNYTVFFRDGSAISFPDGATGTSDDAKAMQSDRLPYGIAVLYDTNGAKGPNMISNCDGIASGIGYNVSDNTSEDTDVACTKDRRVIKDRFGIRLRGGFAVPNGAAARWALQN